MICYDCDSPAVRFFEKYLPCCVRCYDRRRYRTDARREYKKQWRSDNRERQSRYREKWEQKYRRYQYNYHIVAWKATQPVQYSVRHTNHIKDYLRIHKPFVRKVIEGNRWRIRDEMRSAARQELAKLVAAPPELTMKQIKKKQRNIRYRRENHSRMLEYYKEYRERNHEKCLSSGRERHRRNRLKGDAAIVVLRELGVIL